MVDITLSLILIIPLYFDIKYGIIPNYFIGGLMLAGLIINIYQSGLAGISTSSLGFVVGLFLFLIPFILRGLGAGDVKLVAAIGAVKGARFIFVNALVIAIVGGLISLFLLIKENRLGKITQLINKFIYRIPLDDLERQGDAQSFPYGVAIVVGTWSSLLLKVLNLWPV
ncbi:MAG: prepilin peptidase [Halanaerobacter sp.]